MIADFISIKERLEQGMNIFLRSKVQEHAPFINLFGKQLVHEGDITSYETVDHEKKEVEFKKVEAVFQVTSEERRKLTFSDIAKKVEGAAKEMAEKMERGTLQHLSEEIEKAGNLIPGNPELSPWSFLKALEMMEVDFEGTRDKPIMPSLIAGPDAAQKLMEQDAKMTADEKGEINQQREAILDKKYEEYLERENNRKLID